MPATPIRRTPFAHLRTWLLWFAPLLVLWFLYVGWFDRDVLLAGLAAAALAALLAAAIHGAGLLRYRLDLRVLARELRVLPHLYPDFARLVAATVRGGRSPDMHFRWVDFEPDGDDEIVAAGNRVVVTTLSSVAPASYVVHSDGERGRM